MSERVHKSPLPLRALPVVENWQCQGCGVCCRGSIITLSDEDLAKLDAQKWHEHPDFRGVKTVVREGLIGGRRVLAKRDDGGCVFLTDDNRCRIHELHGPDAKPAVCRTFPLQVVPLEKFAYVTARRSCPTAAADEGPTVEQQLPEVKRSGLLRQGRSRPPAIVRGVRRDWRKFLATADALQRLLLDERYPMVRRLIHGLQFCEALEACQLKTVEDQAFYELIQLLENSAAENAGKYFKLREPPASSAASLFRQAGSHYVRLHPGFRASNTWGERWRMMWTSLKFTRGRGEVPAIHPDFPPAAFANLERPLGALPADVARPLNRFLEAHAASKQYAVVGAGGGSLIANFRALALSFPLALWLLRWAVGDRPPTKDDMIHIVVALERGRGMPAIARSAMAMAQARQLPRLIAWYARSARL